MGRHLGRVGVDERVVRNCAGLSGLPATRHLGGRSWLGRLAGCLFLLILLNPLADAGKLLFGGLPAGGDEINVFGFPNHGPR
jgi:hypothetical protein